MQEQQQPQLLYHVKKEYKKDFSNTFTKNYNSNIGENNIERPSSNQTTGKLSRTAKMKQKVSQVINNESFPETDIKLIKNYLDQLPSDNSNSTQTTLNQPVKIINKKKLVQYSRSKVDSDSISHTDSIQSMQSNFTEFDISVFKSQSSVNFLMKQNAVNNPNSYSMKLLQLQQEEQQSAKLKRKQQQEERRQKFMISINAIKERNEQRKNKGELLKETGFYDKDDPALQCLRKYAPQHKIENNLEQIQGDFTEIKQRIDEKFKGYSNIQNLLAFSKDALENQEQDLIYVSHQPDILDKDRIIPVIHEEELNIQDEFFFQDAQEYQLLNAKLDIVQDKEAEILAKKVIEIQKQFDFNNANQTSNKKNKGTLRKGNIRSYSVSKSQDVQDLQPYLQLEHSAKKIHKKQIRGIQLSGNSMNLSNSGQFDKQQMKQMTQSHLVNKSINGDNSILNSATKTIQSQKGQRRIFKPQSEKKTNCNSQFSIQLQKMHIGSLGNSNKKMPTTSYFQP